jgi:hypothetical protein
MILTKQDVADNLLNYLQHKTSLNDLVSLAELMVMDASIKQGEEEIVMEVIGKIGVADVKQFGLYWDDCETMMHKLGYKFQINAIKAA